MALADAVRERCLDLQKSREDAIEDIICEYFEKVFIAENKKWDSSIEPVPIYRQFGRGLPFKWPDLSENLIIKKLISLGFRLTSAKLSSLSVYIPDSERDKELTFAQEWKKKINYSFSRKIEKINEIHNENLLKLCSAPNEQIITYENYSVFKGIEFNIKDEHYEQIREFMERDGIEEYLENGKYIGIKVYHDKP